MRVRTHTSCAEIIIIESYRIIMQPQCHQANTQVSQTVQVCAKDTTTALATTQTAGGVIWWMQIQISMASRLVRGASRNQPYYITQTHDLMTDSDRKYVFKHAITQGLD